MSKIYQGGGQINKSGIYEPSKVEEPLLDISIDKALNDGLVCIRRVMDVILSHTARNVMPPRDEIATLKDCMTMLMDLKKKEQEIVEGMSIEELEKLVKK